MPLAETAKEQSARSGGAATSHKRRLALGVCLALHCGVAG